MRSHISLGEAALEVHAADELTPVSPNDGRGCDGLVAYGLRENPRKTRRLSDFADEKDVGHGVECGKSWKSLFGHIRNHASGDRYHDVDDDEDVEEDEFSVEEGEAEEAEMVKPTEAHVAALTVLSASPRRRRRSMRVAAPPPRVLSGFEKETEDVALCLLMLSRDTGMCSSPAKNETLESAKKIKIKIKIKGGVAKNRKRASRKNQHDPVPVAPKRTRYECPGCRKLFSSYQALGGHRASHKRMNASCSSPKNKITPAASSAPPEPSTTETYTSFNTMSPSASPDSVAIGFGKPKDDEAVPDAELEHKRSHLMSCDCESNCVDLYYVAGAGADHQEQHSAVADGLLDLNFPPAAADET